MFSWVPRAITCSQVKMMLMKIEEEVENDIFNSTSSEHLTKQQDTSRGHDVNSQENIKHITNIPQQKREECLKMLKENIEFNFLNIPHDNSVHLYTIQLMINWFFWGFRQRQRFDRT